MRTRSDEENKKRALPTNHKVVEWATREVLYDMAAVYHKREINACAEDERQGHTNVSVWVSECERVHEGVPEVRVVVSLRDISAQMRDGQKSNISTHTS